MYGISGLKRVMSVKMMKKMRRRWNRKKKNSKRMRRGKRVSRKRKVTLNLRTMTSFKRVMMLAHQTKKK